MIANVKELLRLLAAASPLPWRRQWIDEADVEAGLEIVSNGLRVVESGGGLDERMVGDCDLICAAVNGAPLLLAECQELDAVIADCREIVQATSEDIRNDVRRLVEDREVLISMLAAIKAWRSRHMGDIATPAYRAREDLEKLIAEAEARSK